MATYAIVSSGKVVNMVDWDGSEDWSPSPGVSAIEVPDGETVSIGYSYSGISFNAPVAPVIAPRSYVQGATG
jgi:hypothetical protein